MNNDWEADHCFEHLSACATVCEFKEITSYLIKQFGFSDFCFTVLKAPPVKILTTMPDGLREFYLREDFANYDLFLEHAAGSNSPLFLSDIEQCYANSPIATEQIHRNQKYFKLLASLGFYDCYGVPHGFGQNSRRSIFLYFAKDLSKEDFRQKVEKYQKLLSMMVDAVVCMGMSKFPEHFLDIQFESMLNIKPKHLKLLEMIARDGLNLKEAAAKLKISLNTANKHVAAAKNDLGATTLANAVYLATVHGIISNEKGWCERQK